MQVFFSNLMRCINASVLAPSSRKRLLRKKERNLRKTTRAANNWVIASDGARTAAALPPRPPRLHRKELGACRTSPTGCDADPAPLPTQRCWWWRRQNRRRRRHVGRRKRETRGERGRRRRKRRREEGRTLVGSEAGRRRGFQVSSSDVPRPVGPGENPAFACGFSAEMGSLGGSRPVTLLCA